MPDIFWNYDARYPTEAQDLSFSEPDEPHKRDEHHARLLVLERRCESFGPGDPEIRAGRRSEAARSYDRVAAAADSTRQRVRARWCPYCLSSVNRGDPTGVVRWYLLLTTNTLHAHWPHPT